MKKLNSCKAVVKPAAVFAILFGVLTVLSGGRALFGGAEARAAMGNAVPFVLWFNFLAGFAYIIAGVGLFLRKRSAVSLSIVIAVATALVSLAFGIYVFQGGLFEMRTVFALALRTGVWVVVSWVGWRCVLRKPAP